MSGIPSIRDTLLQGEWNLEHIHLVLQREPSLVKNLEVRGLSTLRIVLTNKKCSVAMVKLLLHYGADPNFKLCGQVIPLFFALDCDDRVGIIRALVEGGARADRPNDVCLSAALAQNADIEVIRLIMSAGADLFRKDMFGVSSLFHALKYFDVRAFRSLLDLQDVDVNTARNQLNGSLLHSALFTEGCTADFVKLLIDRGTKVDSVNRNGDTPLHVAVQNPTCDTNVVDVLLRRGSLVNARNQTGNSPLDLAVVKQCNPDIAPLLLKYFLLENSEFNVKDWIRGHELEEMYFKYAKDCKCELQRMKSENVGSGRTLLEFLLTYSGDQIRNNGAEGFNVELLLQVIAGNLYPLYSNVISSKLERSILKDKLEECNIYTVVASKFDENCVSRKVMLKHDCTRLVANYLDDNDLLSMITAFCY